jgi:hypothetical protein
VGNKEVAVANYIEAVSFELVTQVEAVVTLGDG